MAIQVLPVESPSCPPVLLALHAMATRFELVLHGDNPVRLRAAGEAALGEIERLHAQLSLYDPGSDVARINALAEAEAVRVEPRLFSLLLQAVAISEATGGAFDITAGPLMRAWGLAGGTGRIPTPGELAAARASVGSSGIELDPGARTIRFRKPGMAIDLGSIGKGFAIDAALEVLRDAGVTSALIHGGTSTVAAIGHPPGDVAWRVALPGHDDLRESVPHPEGDAGPGWVELRDSALSVSGTTGKSFRDGDRILGHVMDPRTGMPVEGMQFAAVSLPGATETDAASTALLVLGPQGTLALRARWPGIGVWHRGVPAAGSEAGRPGTGRPPGID